MEKQRGGEVDEEKLGGERSTHRKEDYVLPWNFRGHTDPGQYY